MAPALELLLPSSRAAPVSMRFTPRKRDWSSAFSVARAFAGGMMSQAVPETACYPAVIRSVFAEKKIATPTRGQVCRDCPSAHCVRSTASELRRSLGSLHSLGTRFPNRKAWCGRGDSNPHALRRHPLKMVRLPVPPLPHGGESCHCSRERKSPQAMEKDAMRLRFVRWRWRRLLLRRGRILRAA